jgi:hypothetical protein
MSAKKIYLLQFCRDDGSREAWSVFYTAEEAYETEELRAARIDYLRSRDPELDFETSDLEFNPDPERFYPKYDEDGEEHMDADDE